MRQGVVLVVVALLTAVQGSTDGDETAAMISKVFGNANDSDVDLLPSTGTNDSELDLSPSTGYSRVENCVDQDGRQGKCVLYYQCDPNTRTLITDGAYLLDVRSNKCSHYLKICCLEHNIRDKVDYAEARPKDELLTKGEKVNVVHIPQNDPIESDYDAPDLTPSRHSISEAANNVESTPPAPPQPFTTPAKISPPSQTQECGWSNPGAYIFPVRSLEQAQKSPYANYGEFPWMVAIMLRSEDDTWTVDDYQGGGTIIHPSVVLTVAHKFQATRRREEIRADQLKCRAGEWDTQTTLEQFPFQERNVKKYVIHPEYYNVSVYYDVALLFLESPFDINRYTPHMGVACLANELPQQGQLCFSMGWGLETTESKKFVNVLKKVSLEFVNHTNCEPLLRRTRLGPDFKLHSSLTCAGGREGIDTCTGDGGSSLVCPIVAGNAARYAVYGMVAYGLGCGRRNVPGVYASVPAARAWLDAQMRAEGLAVTYAL